MRRTTALLIAIAAGALLLLGSAERAQAQQNEPIILDNVMAWWDHLGCEEMINAVNAIEDLDSAHPVLAGGETFTPGTDRDNDSEREWCAKWDGLGTNQQRALNAGAMQSRDDGGITTKASDRVFDMTGWWDGMTGEGRNIAIGSTTATSTTIALATSREEGQIRDAYMYLGDDTQPTTTDAPALPLVGIGILGLLLAGLGTRGQRAGR